MTFHNHVDLTWPSGLQPLPSLAFADILETDVVPATQERSEVQWEMEVGYAYVGTAEELAYYYHVSSGSMKSLT
jgi:hypothetical protein